MTVDSYYLYGFSHSSVSLKKQKSNIQTFFIQTNTPKTK